MNIKIDMFRKWLLLGMAVCISGLLSAQKIASFTKSLIALGLDIKFFDVGGGIGICYKDENTIDLYDYAQGILAAIYQTAFGKDVYGWCLCLQLGNGHGINDQSVGE